MLNWIDYAILAIIGLSALISLIRGFVREALSLVIWGCAFFIASHYYPYLATWLTGFQQPMLKNAVAIALLFIATLITGAVVNYIIGTLVDKTGLSGTDRLLGVCFGLLRGILMVAALVFFLASFTSLSLGKEWSQSQLIPHVNVIIQWFFDYFHQNSSFLPRSDPSATSL